MGSVWSGVAKAGVRLIFFRIGWEWDFVGAGQGRMSLVGGWVFCDG